MYYGKPVVGVPVLFDQILNMNVAESKGYAVTVRYEQLDERNLKSAIRTALTDPRFLSKLIPMIFPPHTCI